MLKIIFSILHAHNLIVELGRVHSTGAPYLIESERSTHSPGPFSQRALNHKALPYNAGGYRQWAKSTLLGSLTNLRPNQAHNLLPL